MTLIIPDTDHGKIRVFSVSDPVDGLSDREIEALVATFGNAPLDPDFVDVIHTDDLDDMSLVDYVVQGYDIQPDESDIGAFSLVEGTVVLIMSRAHEGREVTLSLAEGVRHITTLGRGARMTVSAQIDTKSSEGSAAIGDPVGKPPKSDARIGGMVATVALILMFVLVGVMVWVGG